MRLELLSSLVLALTTTVGFCSPDDVTGVSSPLAITQTTQIPGDTLKAGDYSISIVDQLADRMIIRIDSKTTTHHDIFLGVRGTSTNAGDGTVLWQTGLHKAATLRGFNFPNGTRVEFVYPKADAAALAQANSAAVVALDPQSEGHAALKNLSQDEMQVVNLWMLSLTTTGVNSKTPAVLAQRYEPQPDIAVRPPVASTSPEQAASPQIAAVRQPAPVQQAAVAPPSTQPEPARSGGASRPAARKTVIAQLPHTAGYLPLVWFAAALSFLGAMIVRFARSLMERGVA